MRRLQTMDAWQAIRTLRNGHSWAVERLSRTAWTPGRLRTLGTLLTWKTVLTQQSVGTPGMVKTWKTVSTLQTAGILQTVENLKNGETSGTPRTSGKLCCAGHEEFCLFTRLVAILFCFGLSFVGASVQAVASQACIKALHPTVKIYVGSDFGMGDASEPETYATLSQVQQGASAGSTVGAGGGQGKQSIDVKLDAKQSDSPDIEIPPKGGLIGERFVDPKRNGKEIPDFSENVKRPEYRDALHPALSLLKGLQAQMAPLIEGYLAEIHGSEKPHNDEPSTQANSLLLQKNGTIAGSPRSIAEFAKILSLLHTLPPKIELRSGDDPIFKSLPEDRIAATRIGELGAPIVFNRDLLAWGEFSLFDLSHLKFGPSSIGKLFVDDLTKMKEPQVLEFHENTEKLATDTSREALLGWYRILLHELAHQIGLTDTGAVTPDQIAAQFQSYLERQIEVFQFDLGKKEHPWVKVIQIRPTSPTAQGALLLLDSNGVKDFAPQIRGWLNQRFPSLKAERVWFSELRVTPSPGWDVFNWAAPMTLRGTLMIEGASPSAGTAAPLRRREVELTFFIGSDSRLEDPNYNSETWSNHGNAPELITGPKKESLVQLRLLSPESAQFQGRLPVLKTPYPRLKFNPEERWQLMFEVDSTPEELDLVSAVVNIRPRAFRHNVWFREEEPIQLEARLEAVGGKVYLHASLDPQRPIKAGQYVVEKVIGTFRRKEEGPSSGKQKLVSLEMKSQERMIIEVNDGAQSAEASKPSLAERTEGLSLKRFGTLMVKIVDPKDDIRWFPLNMNLAMTWKNNAIPSSPKQVIASWHPVPFVFNRPFNPRHLWIHGSVVVKDQKGKEMSLLFSGALKDLPMLVSENHVYQNKAGETVLELKMHRPLRVNNFEFVRLYVAGMTVVEDNLDVSYHRVHFYFGENVDEKNKNNENSREQ